VFVRRVEWSYAVHRTAERSGQWTVKPSDSNVPHWHFVQHESHMTSCMNPKLLHGLSLRKYITVAVTKLYHYTRNAVLLLPSLSVQRLLGKPLRGWSDCKWKYQAISSGSLVKNAWTVLLLSRVQSWWCLSLLGLGNWISSPYRAVNTLRLGYTNQSVNAV